MADTQLASTIATEIARMLHGELDEISRAVARDTGQVSFSATCTFHRDKEGVLQCKIQPRKGIPMSPVLTGTCEMPLEPWPCGSALTRTTLSFRSCSSGVRFGSASNWYTVSALSTATPGVRGSVPSPKARSKRKLPGPVAKSGKVSRRTTPPRSWAGSPPNGAPSGSSG